jgi:hypothetical protein
MVRLLSLTLCAMALVLLHGPATAGGPEDGLGLDIGGVARMGLSSAVTPSGERRTELIHDLDLSLRVSRTTDFGLTVALEFDLDHLLDGSDTWPPQRERPLAE